MKATKFHRDIAPLTTWEASGLIALAQRLRDELTPGCDCAAINRWGHTAACRIHQEYMREAEQRWCEATEVKITWDWWYATNANPCRVGFDLQIYLTKEFRPSGAGWVGFIQL